MFIWHFLVHNSILFIWHFLFRNSCIISIAIWCRAALLSKLSCFLFLETISKTSVNILTSFFIVFIWPFFVRSGTLHQSTSDITALHHRHKNRAQACDPSLRIRWFLRIIRIYRVYLAFSCSYFSYSSTTFFPSSRVTPNLNQYCSYQSSCIWPKQLRIFINKFFQSMSGGGVT